MRNEVVGKQFAFTQCKAWTDNDNTETTISGLFTVEDLVYPDRSCGQYEAGLWVFESGKEPDAPMFFVDGDAFFEQTDPQGYGRYLVQEREQEWAAEKFDAEYGELFATVGGDDGDIPF